MSAVREAIQLRALRADRGEAEVLLPISLHGVRLMINARVAYTRSDAPEDKGYVIDQVTAYMPDEWRTAVSSYYCRHTGKLVEPEQRSMYELDLCDWSSECSAADADYVVGQIREQEP